VSKYPNIKVKFPLAPTLSGEPGDETFAGEIEFTVRGLTTVLGLSYSVEDDEIYTLSGVYIAETYNRDTLAIEWRDRMKKPSVKGGRDADPARVEKFCNTLVAIDLGRDNQTTIEEVLEYIVPLL